MRKDLYFHSSNLDYANDLRNDLKFEPVHQYDLHSFMNHHQYEWGRIKTPLNYIRLIIGNPPIKNCPWCNTPPNLKKNENPITMFMYYYLECPKCLSRGPVLNVNPGIEIYKDYMDEIISLVNQKYMFRKSWDSDGVLDGFN